MRIGLELHYGPGTGTINTVIAAFPLLILKSQLDFMVAKVGYNMHQITAPDGSVVNEFVSPAGLVFGISWQGQGVPNLQQLLGSYMTNLQQVQRTQVVRRRSVTVQGDNFVFTSFGRMRNFRGRAYVPGLVPANLTPEVVQ